MITNVWDQLFQHRISNQVCKHRFGSGSGQNGPSPTGSGTGQNGPDPTGSGTGQNDPAPTRTGTGFATPFFPQSLKFLQFHTF